MKILDTLLNKLLDTSNIIGPIIIFVIITILVIIKSGRHKIIYSLVYEKGYITNTIITVLIVIITVLIVNYSNISDDNKGKLIEAIKKAIIAFIIAFFSKIDLIFAPFYLVLIFAYYSSGWA